LYNFLKDKKCKAFAALFDVRLAESKDDADFLSLTLSAPKLSALIKIYPV